MAHGFNSTKSFARPAHQALEIASETEIDCFKDEKRRIRNLALRLARRAQNRLLDNEGKLPGTTLIYK